MSTDVLEPVGFTYADDFVDPAVEQELLRFCSSLPFESYVMRGRASKRGVRHFGMRYDYGSNVLRSADPIPAELQPQLERVEEFADLAKGSIVEVLVNYYPPGAGVGWHRDAPVYMTIVGISLGTACTIQFKIKETEAVRPINRHLMPRSAYIMRGAARDTWQHRIPPTKGERFSLTLRSLKD